MAPNKDTQISEADERIQMLKEALKCVTGTLDFDRLATKMNVANAEAMRKRFKRFFEKDEEPIQIKGSALGNNEEGATISKIPRTPKSKVAKLATDGDDSTASPKTKSGRKRKGKEVSRDDEETSKGVTDKEAVTSNDTSPASDDVVADESPKKKAKKTPAKPRKSAKAPQTPKTNKSPRTPPTIKPPGTPKAPLSRGMKLDMEDSDDEGLVKGSASNDHLTNIEDEGVKTDAVMIGSPAIQAKTNVLIKATEEANGSALGEPAKQVKRETVKANMEEEAGA